MYRHSHRVIFNSEGLDVEKESFILKSALILWTKDLHFIVNDTFRYLCYSCTTCVNKSNNFTTYLVACSCVFENKI